MTASEFVRKADKKSIRMRSALMEHAAVARGYAVDRISVNTILVGLGGRRVAFQDMNGPTSSAAAKSVCANKATTRCLLAAAGLPVGSWRAFAPDAVNDGWAFAHSIDGPVVVKPATQAMSRGVTTGVADGEAFVAAWRHAAAFYEPPAVSPMIAEEHASPPLVLVEAQVEGADFRCFVVGDRVVAVIERRPPTVRGDGRRSVAELIEEQNRLRADNPGLAGYPIPLEPHVLEGLAASGLDLEDVPRSGEVLTLHDRTSLVAGAETIESTESVHPGFADVALAALAAVPGLRYGAVDLLAPTVSAAPTLENHVVGEVEFAPGPMSHFPAAGEPRDVAGAILEFYAGEHDVTNAGRQR